jgi:hypothetical protein
MSMTNILDECAFHMLLFHHDLLQVLFCAENFIIHLLVTCLGMSECNGILYSAVKLMGAPNMDVFII